ncbi:hypothetical protein ACFVRD_37965 [Streptomyces sp. NPDC057908]|uniref:hypothetical protein n=1 Tax=Streptomyces sp. NPDC057908 TaxID=3346276 RepID=UPI0036E863CD
MPDEPGDECLLEGVLVVVEEHAEELLVRGQVAGCVQVRPAPLRMQGWNRWAASHRACPPWNIHRARLGSSTDNCSTA